MGMYEDDVRTVPRGGPDYGPSGPGYGYGPGPMYGYGYRARPMWPVETKPFFLTSEFWGAVLAIAGIAITAAASDSFGAWRAWILITAVAVAYLVSRGIAKSGTKSRAWDPREELMTRVRDKTLDRDGERTGARS